MEIIKEYPPNYEEIIKVFDLSGTKPVFAWGDKLYNPHDMQLAPDILVHEQVHQAQQKNEPKDWWDLYLKDKSFRLDMESEAYAYQYAYIKSRVRAKLSKKFLELFANTLSSKMYGEIIDKKKAETLLRKRAKDLLDKKKVV